jgi:hypothetical protein
LTILLPGLAFGWWVLPAFAHHLPYLGGGLALAENVSLPGLIARLHVGPAGLYTFGIGQIPPSLAVMAAAGSVGLLGWALQRARRQSVVTAYRTVSAAGLLAAPTAWDHYPTWLLPFLVAPLADPESGGAARRWLFLTGIGLLFLPINALYLGGLLPLAVAGLPWRQAGLLLVLLPERGARLTSSPNSAPDCDPLHEEHRACIKYSSELERRA